MLLHPLAAEIAVFSFDGQRAKSVASHGNATSPTGLPSSSGSEPGIDAKRLNLVRLRVGDEASMQVLAGTRGLRQERSKLAGRA